MERRQIYTDLGVFCRSMEWRLEIYTGLYFSGAKTATDLYCQVLALMGQQPQTDTGSSKIKETPLLLP